jgi:hypothetical protein
MAKFEPWIADCQFQQTDAHANCQSRAAVWADGPDSFRAQLSEHVQRQGLTLIWAEDCYPVPQYLAKHPARQREIGPVARVVCQNHPVVLTDMVTVEGEDQQAKDCHCVIVTPVEDVEPLDMQLGVYPPRSVPEVLQRPLFGAVDAIDEEADFYGGADSLPPMRTYAVLDASKMPYVLTGLLETSGLRFQSLFQRKTQQELGEYAPYLIELAPDSSFTRNLFTCSDGIQGLWEKGLGIYIRSRAGFEDVRRHLRKFTRLRDDDDQWHYFRFWESSILSVFTNEEAVELAEALLNDGTYRGQTWLVPTKTLRDVVIIHRAPGRYGAPTSPPRLTAPVILALDDGINALRDAQDISGALDLLPESTAEQEIPDTVQLQSSLNMLWDQGFKASEKRQEALCFFIRASWLGKTDDASQILQNTAQGPAIRLWHLRNMIEGNAE